jgi:hypothetical protein
VTERTDPDRIVVIVSDLVQSEKARSQHEFIEAFRRAAGARSDVLLLGFRSAFRGQYYVETPAPRPVDAWDLDLDGASPAKSRPFYFVILAPSRRSLTQFRKYVLDHLQPHEEFYASDPPVAIDTIDFVPDGAFGIYDSPPIQPLSPRLNAGFLGTFIERVPPKGTANLRLRLSGVSRLSMVSVENLQYEVSQKGPGPNDWVPRDDVAIKVDARAPRGARAGDSTKLSLVLGYELPRVQPYSWNVYRVRIRAGRANVVTPAWITEWATSDDRPFKHVHLTLNLGLAGEAMVRAITEEVVLTEQYLRVGRES